MKEDVGCCDGTLLGTGDLSPLEQAAAREAFVSHVIEAEPDLPYTYDIRDSIEASNGRPLSDLRNLSRFGDFCCAAMAASLLQAGG